MEVLVLRHGEAGKRGPIDSRDYERALTAVGREEVEEVAQSLKEQKLRVDKIVTSPLRRARETAEIVAERLKKRADLEAWDELKPEADRRGLYRRLSNLKQDGAVMLVGHEPYLSELISEVISGNARCRIALKKTGMAKLEVTSLSPTPHGELRWLLTPRQLKKLS